ncbi:PREDICTED: uncharacterized protein LOC109239187 [Nicotiana attenuata]|uniref:uncharacterized protein LOC109239187 n=1 Tax=Nicotiana attenuata TaxID=49451 RepID=UPI0009046BC1|nr:PREDICTED: uncharacterized protein LOC109239187 [Nicotiana attenuata]
MFFRFLDLRAKEPDFNVVVEGVWNVEVQGSPMWRAYKKEESFWKQKSAVKWFVEGEVNSRFFHSIVKGRKKRLSLKKMRRDDGNWIEEEKEIAKEAVSFFQKQFTKDSYVNNFSALNCIRKLIDEANNVMLNAVPTMEELKGVIPKAITHTCLIYCLRLSAYSLSKLTSPNQIGFIKGRSITDNIMMTQDIVHNITKPSPRGNFVLKLHMTKAYDGVSWEYLFHVLREMGFSECWIESVWRLMSNVWYSININGVRYGFFKSSRGIKQGDPLSPSLFVIGAEILSRLIDSLLESNFISYSANKNGPHVTHLYYAADTILFSSCDYAYLRQMMTNPRVYEQVSGQLVNKEKSGFYVTLHDVAPTMNDIRIITGLSQC